jgi:hypothetical protein
MTVQNKSHCLPGQAATHSEAKESTRERRSQIVGK